MPADFFAVPWFSSEYRLPVLPACWAAAFLDAVVAVFLTVLLPPVASQEHAPLQNAMLLGACIEGRSALQAMAKMLF
jgi:hypothetical protein